MTAIMAELKKDLRLYGLIMVAIGSCIGSGIFFGLTAAGVLVLRHKRKDLARPYKTFGYPVVPLIFISITFLFVLNVLIAKPLHAWAGLFLILASLPI